MSMERFIRLITNFAFPIFKIWHIIFADNKRISKANLVFIRDGYNKSGNQENANYHFDHVLIIESYKSLIT